MKNTKLFITATLMCFFLCLGSECFAGWNLTEDGSIFMQGRFVTSGIFRTIDSNDKTPLPVRAGDLVQQRNTVLMEFTHKINPDLKYFIQGRVFYDGVWDYGPSIFSNKETRAFYGFTNNDQITNDKLQASIFLAYVDYTLGNAALVN